MKMTKQLLNNKRQRMLWHKIYFHSCPAMICGFKYPNNKKIKRPEEKTRLQSRFDISKGENRAKQMCGIQMSSFQLVVVCIYTRGGGGGGDGGVAGHKLLYARATATNSNFRREKLPK